MVVEISASEIWESFTLREVSGLGLTHPCECCDYIHTCTAQRYFSNASVRYTISSRDGRHCARPVRGRYMYIHVVSKCNFLCHWGCDMETARPVQPAETRTLRPHQKHCFFTEHLCVNINLAMKLHFSRQLRILPGILRLCTRARYSSTYSTPLAKHIAEAIKVSYPTTLRIHQMLTN